VTTISELDQFETVELTDDVLAHFGVKGMHWGVRKSGIGGAGAAGSVKKSAPSAPLPDHPEYRNTHRATDTRNYGKGGVERINANMHKGMTLKDARNREANIHDEANKDFGKNVAAGLATATAGYMAVNVGTRLAREAAWSPKTLAAVSSVAQKMPFQGKVILANGLMGARIVTAVAASPNNRYVGKWVAASMGARLGANASQKRSLKRAVKRDAERNG
jgi:hypothetical protein